MLKMDFPPALLFVEAKAAEKTGDPGRAFAALEMFMKVADRKSEQYQQALALYPSYSAAAEARAMVKAEEDAKAKALADAEAKRKSDAEASAREARELERRPQEIKEFLAQILSELVSIPGGSFQMGEAQAAADPLYRFTNWSPPHVVQIKPFRVGKHLVTGRQLIAYLRLSGRPLKNPGTDIALYEGDGSYSDGKHPSYYPSIYGNSDLAMEATWGDVSRFLKWISDNSGQHFRLLSEAEWEYVARNRKDIRHILYDSGDFNPKGKHFDIDVPIGFVQPEGFSKLRGSKEWTADCEHDSYMGAPNDGSAWIAEGDCVHHVVRNGMQGIERIHALLPRSLDDKPAVAGRQFEAEASVDTAYFRVVCDP
jgi:formylglycine-generating enzyme required for sulfatase activity